MILSGACSLQLTTTKTSIVDYNVEFTDYSPGLNFYPNCTFGKINTIGTTTILTSSNANFLRKVRGFSIINSDNSASQNITLSKQVGGLEYKILNSVPLKSLESIYCDQNDNIVILDKFGVSKINNELDSPVGATIYEIRKNTFPAEIIGSGSATFSCVGFPGAWSPGTPGITGRNCYGSSIFDSGSTAIPNINGQYISSITGIVTVIQNPLEIIDALWVNTGIDVTATSIIQPISSSTFPARDLYGTTNGLGYKIGLLVTATTTNVNGIRDTVVQYTNSDGIPNRWASVSSSNSLTFVPGTAVFGTFVPFNLQDGDEGVRSIEGIINGASFGAGALSLMVYKPLTRINCSLSNMAITNIFDPPGIKLWGDECILVWNPYVSAVNTYNLIVKLIVNTYA